MRRGLLVTLGSLYACIAFEITARGVEAVFNAWRCPANGGANVLYCYLRVNGRQCVYADLLNQQSEKPGNAAYSIKTLAYIAAKNGLPLQPVSLSMNDLMSCPKPVIVHMDGKSPEAGAFLLILSIKDSSMHYLNGPSATIHQMRIEDFRRVWTGFALLPRKDGMKDAIYAAIGFSLGIVVTFVCKSVRAERVLKQ